MTSLKPLMVPAMLASMALALPACTSQEVRSSPAPASSGGPVELAPSLSVEGFLQAVNVDDWAAMSRLFGTKEGPYSETVGDRREIELRMNAIALILKHEDFEITSQRRVPGRENPSVRLGVNLTIDGGLIPDVSFIVVQSDAGSWLVEEIDLVKVTSG
jgi:hypothetical protein